ncbi:MAG: sigma-70 family RNA polymerase sigma factor [Chitinophagaceae bacterium]|nr:sigma-70 family RNA polymerase sigma factor [Chitinophagaceae bacterium]
MKLYQTYDIKVLTALIVKGDEQAFAEVYERYWKKLFVIANNRLKDIPASEDTVHDVFAGLWANRAKKEIITLENYLATAVKYAVLDKLKKKARERKYFSATQAPVYVLPVDQSVYYKLLLEKVNLEVEKLPEQCRLIFTNSRNREMPVKEIAKELHLSPKTVANQLYKAKNQLKHLVKTFLGMY